MKPLHQRLLAAAFCGAAAFATAALAQTPTPQPVPSPQPVPRPVPMAKLASPRSCKELLLFLLRMMMMGKTLTAGSATSRRTGTTRRLGGAALDLWATFQLHVSDSCPRPVLEAEGQAVGHTGKGDDGVVVVGMDY